jgi:hypothetical protein
VELRVPIIFIYSLLFLNGFSVIVYRNAGAVIISVWRKKTTCTSYHSVSIIFFLFFFLRYVIGRKNFRTCYP